MITYRKGDAVYPDIQDYRECLIMHICNDRSAWGKGFVKALSKRWPEPEAAYRKWAQIGSWSGRPFTLGESQLVFVEKNIGVVNMIAQTGYGYNNQEPHQGRAPNTTPPIRYEALDQCLRTVHWLSYALDAVVVAPKIGSGLAGGDWKRIEAMINERMPDRPVHIYEL